jgi:hypothetical protein
MPAVLTEAAAVTCGHSGVVSTAGIPKLTVNNSPVLTKLGVAGHSVKTGTCLTVLKTDSAGVVQDKPCSTVSGVTAGEASKLTIGKNPVLTTDLKGGTDGLVAKEPQSKVGATVVSPVKLTSA